MIRSARIFFEKKKTEKSNETNAARKRCFAFHRDYLTTENVDLIILTSRRLIREGSRGDTPPRGNWYFLYRERERERERETDRECVCVCLSDASGPRHSRTIKRGYQLDPREPPLAPIRDCFERVPLTLTVERDFYLTNRSPFFRSTGGKINRQTGPSVVDPLDHFSSRSRAETRKGCSFTR